ncbi:hypothetical protein KJ611_01180 [Patescibacteria group bacterium]|nr:hypothetical protein [Patescibacteria group bacterium]MBU1705296.1 hypothetical protein [Patescibacteria group bacterium]
MRYTHSFGKTNKQAPHDADSANARLLIQGGFIDQLAAGVYSYLPLGLRALNKVKNVIREEMDALGAQEILMPALTPKDNWVQTGRWDEIDVLFKLEGAGGKEYALGSTHEEIVTPLVKKFVNSYKDLPVAVYQIQDKFRNEPRAKSGLLRGREFSMKDLYSFHQSIEDLDEYYEEAIAAYNKIFQRLGIPAIVTEASGGDFSKYSHEFQTPTESGEDTIFVCDKCQYAQNLEITEYQDGDACPKCDGIMRQMKAVEVGNIFKLKTRFTDAFDFHAAGEDGQEHDVYMGCYGIGPSRLMGAIVDVHHDDQGILWPKAVAPFPVHLITLNAKDEAVKDKILRQAETLYQDLDQAGLEVFWDDREVSAGEKFADADLIGLPLRLVLSEKTLKENSVEWKERAQTESRLVKLEQIIESAKSFIQS